MSIFDQRQGPKTWEPRDDAPYWMVHCPGRGAPSAMHPSADAARREAERLARTNPGGRFYVLKAMGWVEQPEPMLVMGRTRAEA